MMLVGTVEKRSTNGYKKQLVPVNGRQYGLAEQTGSANVQAMSIDLGADASVFPAHPTRTGRSIMVNSHHKVLADLQDRILLMEYEPGEMSKVKQAHEIARALQNLPLDELTNEDQEIYRDLKVKVWDILNG